MATSFSSITKNGYYVKNVRFDTIRIINNNQFKAIQQCFPNLRGFASMLRYKEDILSFMPGSWNVWTSSLRELTIASLSLGILSDKKATMKFLSQLPGLSLLNLIHYNPHQPFQFGMDEFEKLHKLLPRLSDLSLIVKPGPLSKKDLSIIDKVQPIHHFTRLNLTVFGTPYQRPFYFAYKYPNLRSLEWENSVESDMISGTWDSNIDKLFEVLPRTFGKLESVIVGTRETLALRVTHLLSYLDRAAVSAKHLNYRYLSIPAGPDPALRTTEPCITMFSTTLKRFSLTYPTCFVRVYVKKPIFEYCHCLTELNLINLDIIVELDVLFNCLPSLTRFTFYGGIFSVSQGVSNTVSNHGFLKLNLKSIRVKFDAFEYMSFHCRELRAMDLIRVKVSGHISQSTGNILLNMPYIILKSLNICNMQYFDENDAEYQFPINIMRVSQQGNSGEERRGKENPQ
ncbi:hypothetical protein J3Q64DRAFT_1722660 [Phycomyces blakesleeanus]|uniref:Uncharacterized protein n=1 Tax=Phycomyces blakesleeanus TaxID=4837 RepID=A0ABR3BE53_PHYBL